MEFMFDKRYYRLYFGRLYNVNALYP